MTVDDQCFRLSYRCVLHETREKKFTAEWPRSAIRKTVKKSDELGDKEEEKSEIFIKQYTEGKSNIREISEHKLTKRLLVNKRIILTERSPWPGEVSTTFLVVDCVAFSAQWILTDINLGLLDREPLFFHPCSSSITRIRPSGPRCRPTTPQKIW
jgi:hypothetical protein